MDQGWFMQSQSSDPRGSDCVLLSGGALRSIGVAGLQWCLAIPHAYTTPALAIPHACTTPEPSSSGVPADTVRISGSLRRSDSQHRFWKPSEVEEEVVNANISELHSRHITFAGTFKPVQHRCRALRPDGRLCERQDRLKCPFHGKIIPRDDEGRPLDPEERAREQRQQRQKQERPGEGLEVREVMTLSPECLSGSLASPVPCTCLSVQAATALSRTHVATV
ncbi:hypothetical protein P7K49_005832 [Saguinus oedipus]|uniref:UV-stimulated scaffold protein A C-terminal domain-containing protein n=1 Tax=Saguinus oedipus TaxID=9490 RepID=A0ABQ9W1G9_SAGOE|nr:hypothetical protein P7K49_005832 [Saguinus oedipus]